MSINPTVAGPPLHYDKTTGSARRWDVCITGNQRAKGLKFSSSRADINTVTAAGENAHAYVDRT